MQHDKRRPVVLCILDGWGDAPAADDNAISLGETPVWDRLSSSNPRAQLSASESDVGLPAGQMGNSEVGHINLGAGRISLQDLPRIDASIACGEFSKIPELQDMVAALKESGGTCHLMGVVSPGGVHSHRDHMIHMSRVLSDAGIPVAVHTFLDGRDTPPKSAYVYMDQFLHGVSTSENVKVATLCGRYFALDRDNRWDRVKKAHDLIAYGVGNEAAYACPAIDASYEMGLSDEFIEPIVVGGYEGMKDGDGILVANFRADRAREILTAFVDPDFDGFERRAKISFSSCVGMIDYSSHLNQYFTSLFKPVELDNILGQVVSEAGLKQLRIAETEKYAHVTFFFNGGREDVFEGEERILIPSPDVATYDLNPAMSAVEVTDNLVRVIGDATHDLIIVNFANGDMVGHTGIMSAAIEATQTLDGCLGRLEEAILAAGGCMLVTADHGNCESMKDHQGGPHTAHTLNAVPAVLVNGPQWARRIHDGRLCDVAPTLLQLLGLPQPDDMTGCTLIDDSAAC